MAPKASKFSMDAAIAIAAKRPSPPMPTAERSTKIQKASVPKASDLTLVEQVPRETALVKRLPAWAPVVVCIYKVTDEASDVCKEFEDTKGVQLWQVQVQHEARPSVTFGIVQSFNEFLCQANIGEDFVPMTLQDLQRKAGIKLVITDHTDPDSVGFVPWRIAFYVGGTPEADSLNNFLYLLDDFFIFKEKAMERDRPFEVYVYPQTGIDIGRKKLQYDHYTFNDATDILPLGIFEAQPVEGKRIVQLHLQPEDENHLSILVLGQHWNYRGRLDLHGVPGTYFGDEQNRKYVRVLKSINVADKLQQQRVFDMIGGKDPSTSPNVWEITWMPMSAATRMRALNND
eukprot:1292581-Karenia_brevis.AAC.1